MGGVQMQRLLRTHVVVVFGATSRVGKATVEALAQQHEGVTAVLAVERPKDARVKALRRATGSYAVQCDFADPRSLQRAVRHADAVLLVPALSPSGTAFSKRVLDACAAEDVARIVLMSSLLATDDYWRRQGGTVGSYEAIEAHARNLTNNCVTLRVPLLMETLLYCRDEIMFASRFFSCFQPTTAVPCMAVADVARAACVVLTKPATVKFDATYSLANADVTCSPTELAQLLTRALGRTIQAKYVSDAELTRVLADKGVSEVVAAMAIRFKHYLEMERGVTTHAALQTMLPPAATATGATTAATDTKAPLPLTRVGFSNDYRTLTKRALTTPSEWLQANRVYFERSAANQMQLFVMGAGEGLFQEIERLVAQQVTAPLARTEPSAMPRGTNNHDDDDEMLGEATIPTATGAAVHSKATFCTIKTVPGGRQRQQAPLAAPPPTSAPSQRRTGTSRRRHAAAVSQEEAPSPMVQLLSQLTSADVVVFVPPLRFGATECMDVLRVVVDAARRARCWGIVVVSSVFTGRGWADSVNRMGDMEQFVERSGVPYAIVRLPLFMEYFLALSPVPSSPQAPLPSTIEEEKQPEAEPQPKQEPERPRGLTDAAATTTTMAWPLLDRALATTPQYLMATADAAKALVSVAYTFPLHRNKIRAVYTERRTMREIEACLQQHAYKHTSIDLSQIDALRETRGREFWRVAYWTKHHVKSFLETEVALSSDRTAPLAMAESYEDLTECPAITLDKWAVRHAKALARTLGGADDRHGRASSRARPQGSATAQQHQQSDQQQEELTRPTLARSHEEKELLPRESTHTTERDEPRPMKLPTTAAGTGAAS